MKKLVTMAVLLIVLGICLPAYSVTDVNDNILVYKVSISGKVFDVNGFGSGRVKGYAVVDVNTTDVNSAFIAYGKYDGDKIQETWVISVERDLEEIGSWGVGVEFWEKSDYWFEGIALGKAKETDIGVDDEALVAKSLSGNILLWVNPLTGEELLGSGKISLKLDRNTTEEFNALDYTIAEAVAEIEEYLEVEKEYIPYD